MMSGMRVMLANLQVEEAAIVSLHMTACIPLVTARLSRAYSWQPRLSQAPRKLHAPNAVRCHVAFNEAKLASTCCTFFCEQLVLC